MKKGAASEIRALLPVVILAVMMSAAASSRAATPGLAPCPSSPNCVSSLADDREHHTAPLRYTGDPARAWNRLKAALKQEPRLSIVKDTGSYLHAEARSLVFRFVDDVEFVLDPRVSAIQVRSASRIGYSDFGVNRRRVERIRKAFNRQQ